MKKKLTRKQLYTWLRQSDDLVKTLNRLKSAQKDFDKRIDEILLGGLDDE